MWRILARLLAKIRRPCYHGAMIRRPLPLLILILVVLGLLANLLVLMDLTDISSQDPLPSLPFAVPHERVDRDPVRIGVISRFAPSVIYAGYQPIMDYLNRSGTHFYELRLSTSYQDAVNHLRARDVEASFLGAWIFGHLESDVDLFPIAAPVNAMGRSEFQSLLVTRADSDLTSIEQLKGKKVALPSAQSWSGNWLQTSGLAEAGLSAADLDSIHHFDHHQTVVWQVLRGEFDAGVVKETVAAEHSSEGLRIIARSKPIPGPPLVGHLDVAPEILSELSTLLLALDPDDPTDRQVLESWTPEFSHGFTVVPRGQYRRTFEPEEESE